MPEPEGQSHWLRLGLYESHAHGIFTYSTALHSCVSWWILQIFVGDDRSCCPICIHHGFAKICSRNWLFLRFPLLDSTQGSTYWPPSGRRRGRVTAVGYGQPLVGKILECRSVETPKRRRTELAWLERHEDTDAGQMGERRVVRAAQVGRVEGLDCEAC